LSLTADNIVAIYDGRIRHWDDSELVLNNPELVGVHEQIISLHRADGSGTTYGFTRFLSDASPKWRYARDLGSDTIVYWPRGLSAVGNDGVANTLRDNPYSIGYVDLNFAIKDKLSYASVQNKSGLFVEPTLASVNAAAASIQLNHTDLRMNLIDAPGKDAYPLVTATYILVHKNQQDSAKATALVRLLWWMTHEGQALNESMFYAQVPSVVTNATEQALRQISVKGQPVLGN
jgi:phosphate transport system substrate-binding protein